MTSIDKARRADEPKLSPTGLYAGHTKVYPKAVTGPARAVKWGILAFCLSVYYLLPWVRWDRGPGRVSQAVLLDLPNRRFYFFDLVFWSEDIYYLTGLMILGAVGLFLVTSLAGRVWCGYACPQTVWTDLFMWIERLVQGDRNARMRLDQGPNTADRIRRKALTHAIWLGIAFWTGGAWIMYFVDAPTLTVQFWTGQAAAEAYFFIFLFTATTYLLAGWAREQVCTYMCPWPRFQAAMLDEQSLIVTYQAWRGEPRGHGKRDGGAAVAGLGSCIDCQACVHACPTGIDIRDGVQLECINCGLCVDACNEMMVKTGQPKWLVTWDTLAGQKAKVAGRHEKFHLLRPRTLIYLAALVVAIGVMGVALATRPHIGLSVQRDRAPLFVLVRDGNIRNGYTLKVSNKTQDEAAFTLTLDRLPGALMTIAEESEERIPTVTLTVAPDSIGTFRVLVFGRPRQLEDGSQKIDFLLRNNATGEATSYTSAFMGPRGAGR
ncbi:Nitrogen fixation protein FixG [Rhodovastum atsumiense]|uniref:Cytochrome c oxidase accessory protein CcoG n=1 Tax=Rhodovastum atsumiense TaxID=504468 RepID=A0A5M6J2C8_9PROT|nr:cytochrome c oxidase accessory protein CcoG [Rhodovastum atsumiense]KAA5614750.1 cytochrome c oxidase accessory protein CcoG [Rhodovastum atsumiense]CAH2599703.1 Nitrogen fixation protein FixG [Rhodovastum atsumiense]